MLRAATFLNRDVAARFRVQPCRNGREKRATSPVQPFSARETTPHSSRAFRRVVGTLTIQPQR